MANIQLLLLAAGESKRMGKPKQLLQWNSQTLIEHQLKNLLATGKSVSIILGAYSEEITEKIKNFSTSIHVNKDWKNGMGSSVSFGVKQVLAKDKTIDGILISLVDQPFLTTEYFIKLINNFQRNQQQIIVSQSEKGWFGAPVLFDKIYFEELINLKNDGGAKVVISKYKNCVKIIDGGKILKDMDTPEVYRELFKAINNL